MRFDLRLSAAIVTMAAVMTPALAEEESTSKQGLEGVSLGEHWYGPKISTEDLKGRVVLIEFWGIN